MDTWRIKVQLNDKSASVGTDTSLGIGATVIPASRGQLKPVKFSTGQTERIRQLYGATRHEVLEAIAYNTKYPIWISAPHTNGVCSGVAITDDGLVPFNFTGEADSISLSNLSLSAYAGEADGEVTSMRATMSASVLPEPSTSSSPAIQIKVGSETLDAENVYWAEDTHQYTFTVNYNEIATSGSLTIEDGTATFEWNTLDPIEKGAAVTFRITVDLTSSSSTVYAIIGMRFPCEDFIGAAVYKSEYEDNLMLALYQKKDGDWYSLTGYPKEFSLIEGTLNAMGLNIYAPILFKDDDNIFVEVNSKAEMVWDTWEGGSEVVTAFSGGRRGDEPSGQLLVEAWEQFKDTKKYYADIYFDETADENIPTEFVALRESFAKYKTFLYPQPTMSAADMLANTPLNISNRGIATFWGSAEILNPYEATGNLISHLMGEIAAKYADARVLAYGGRAVAWGDENGVGGQLDMGRIVEFVYNATEDESKDLGTARVNPVGPNDLFGPIVYDSRSTDKSSGNYSYMDYSGIVDYCVERIYDEVLPYQLIKFNDDSHRATVRSKADLILRPLLAEPNNVIRDYAIKCDAENNDDDVLSREEFVLTIAIKVTPKARTILFNFINSAQGASVEEDVA